MEHQVYFEIDIFNNSSLDNEQTGQAIELAKWLCNELPSELDADYLDGDWGCTIFLSEPYASTVSVYCGFVEKNSYSVAIKSKRSFFECLLRKTKNCDNTTELKEVFDKLLNENINVNSIEWDYDG